jgi:hypothetical protein
LAKCSKRHLMDMKWTKHLKWSNHLQNIDTLIILLQNHILHIIIMFTDNSYDIPMSFQFFIKIFFENFSNDPICCPFGTQHLMTWMIHQMYISSRDILDINAPICIHDPIKISVQSENFNFSSYFHGFPCYPFIIHVYI